VEFLSNFRTSSPLHKRKALIEDFLETVWFSPKILKPTSGSAPMIGDAQIAFAIPCWFKLEWF